MRLSSWGRVWADYMLWALKRSGCPDSGLVLPVLQAASMPGQNQNLVELEQETSTPSSTYAEAIDAMSAPLFEPFSLVLQGLLPWVRRLFPPDGPLTLVLDPTEEPYSPDMSQPPKGPEWRYFFVTASSAENTGTKQCNKILGIAVSWTCKGRAIVWPVYFRLLRRTEMWAANHVRKGREIIDAMEIEVAWSIGDRAYGIREVLQDAIDEDRDCLVRVTHSGNGTMKVHPIAGPAKTVAQLLDEVSNDKRLKVLHAFIRGGKGRHHRRMRTAFRIRRMLVRLSPSGRPIQLVIRAELKSRRNGRGRRWVLDPQGSIVIATTDLTLDTKEILAKFAERWGIEVLYRYLGCDLPANRPKKTKRFSVEWCAHVFRLLLGYLAMQYLFVYRPHVRINGKPLSRYSAHLLGRHTVEGSQLGRQVIGLLNQTPIPLDL